MKDPNVLLLEDQVKLQAPELLAYVNTAKEQKELKYFAAVSPSRKVPDDWGEPMWLETAWCCYLVQFTDVEEDVPVWDHTTGEE